jgi:hypothetical protein
VQSLWAVFVSRSTIRQSEREENHGNQGQHSRRRAVGMDCTHDDSTKKIIRVPNLDRWTLISIAGR